MEEEIKTAETEKEVPEKKPRRGGRKAQSPAEKEAAAKSRAEEKAKADNLKPEYILQYQGTDVSLEQVAEAAKAAFRQENKRTLVTDLKLYIKPEEHAAYYVINGSYSGKVDL